MNLDNLMAEYGFAPSSSGGGCMWYTRETTSKGKPAFIAITDVGGCDLPESMEEPIMVGIYDLEEGECTDGVKEFPSLKSYLETVKK